ncbi:MAG TPA: UvrD-helicase domain-containing protein [Sandaracinaceae bacterium LLY-WYZ-13_1]|nr:UvrD-helicase domain-containing protein [Sandaracinaceae bacterium LLY-WYZ-13_1]
MNIDPVDPGLAGLNPPQREAVLHDGGPLVVFAGAGSGKTRVITHRVAHLVAERGAAPWNVLAVTFTNKAAQEMRERLGGLVGGAARDLWVGTFHATCARLLRRYAKEVGVKRDFTIYDQSDSEALVKRVLRDLELDPQRYAPKAMANRIGREKQEVRGPGQMAVGNVYEENVQRVFVAYEARKRDAGALDFADLLYRLVVALEGDDALRGELQRRFRHLLVDEFQDTNHVQYRLVRALAATHRQVTVVGDDDQSIYRWRGADRRNILNFREEFPDARIVKLEQNYRSTARILRAANSIIARAAHREPKELWTENEEGASIHVVTCQSERQEAELVVEAVEQLRQAGRGLDEIALFYRIHAQSRNFEEVLRRRNLPYRIVGGLRFYDRAEVKDILAYLRVLSNPDDDVSLLRIINTPARGIGKKSVERLLDRAAREGVGVFTALRDAAEGKGRAAKRFAAFVALIDGLRGRLEAGEKLAALGWAVYEESGYHRWLKDQDTAEADARHQNVQELLGAVQLAQEETPELDLPTFLEQVALDTDKSEDGEDQARLTLMTVHAAKGLEFPVVVVSGLEEDTFPFRRTQEELDEDAVEEERRLAYVAMTRARERLLLTWAVTRRLFGRVRPMTRSRFLLELPPEDVRRVGEAGPRAPARARGGWRGASAGDRAPAAWRAPSRPGPAHRPPPPPRIAPGDSYVDPSEGSDFIGGVEVGMPVRHRKFGVGRIVQIKPTTPPRVAVEFGGKVRTIGLDWLQPA